MIDNDYQEMVDIYDQAGGDKDIFTDSDIAHLVIERDEVIGSNLVEGLEVDVKDNQDDLVEVKIVIKEGHQIAKPVHLCFGVLPEEGLQQIDMDITVEDDAAVEILAHCVFPNARDVTHKMDAEIKVRDNSEYIYREVHDHGTSGGVEVIANTDIVMQENSLLKTIFNLFEGRAGLIDIAYESEIGANSNVEMIAKISGSVDDQIKIKENADLIGVNARGLLETRIALQDQARADILNEMTAYAAGAKGHVDCTEIIKDEANARAVPVVDVRHPEAKVTHEAAIGSIDSTQLQTLLARGLDEEEASDVIIQGMLRG
ncbi:SufB/SufD family protein [Acetohalobium arabaticum]|uniref:SufBD protein n=1 Tax=Acetohalobium arabaticum (strain ATCC 49924 / DSM 5501 / Z-7288) TaxID=574087 RepID=D9QT13_ACEAZ|nr:SufD family Fe-S cluster assembly protein [Acetohalobium arabaticum]ADL13513.1 SufBD protein [Acetohalobium arabaticum DSM 5501]